MFDKIITITINPSIDATLWIEKLDFEEPTRCKSRKDYSGGKGINVSKTLSALGVSNLAVSVVGRDNVKTFEKLLKADKVDYCFIENDGAIRENLALIFPEGEGQKLLKINFAGFELSCDTTKKLKDIVVEKIGEARAPLLVFAGSLPKGMTASQYKSLIIDCKKEIKNSNVILDNDLFKLEDLKQIEPFAIKPNHVELSHIFDKVSISVKEATQYGKMLAEFIPHVLISMGADGLLYCNKKTEIIAGVPKVEVKSTIGAGDSTLAGFIAAITNKKEIGECIKFAAACGTAAVMLEGTQTIDRKLAENIFRQVDII